ncbi:MAG: hypothetical protein U5L11_06880 [Arhodomonas sp.]|nr:hypothetical protein [Arhodomonas sp.]
MSPNSNADLTKDMRRQSPELAVFASARSVLRGRQAGALSRDEQPSRYRALHLAIPGSGWHWPFLVSAAVRRRRAEARDNARPGRAWRRFVELRPGGRASPEAEYPGRP